MYCVPSGQCAVSPRVRCVQLQRTGPPFTDVVMVHVDGVTADQRRKVFAVQSHPHSITIATVGGGPATGLNGLILPPVNGHGYITI